MTPVPGKSGPCLVATSWHAQLGGLGVGGGGVSTSVLDGIQCPA